MILLIAYLAGLLTLINPCVLPVLPIVLTASLHQDRRAPLALAAGMSGSFILLGIAISALGPALGLRADTVNAAAALVMAGFGLVLLVPSLGKGFSSATAAFAARADAGISTAPQGLAGQALGGALLGVVWSPCIGPTLGAAIGMAASGRDLGLASAIMLAFAAGVSTLILALAYGARRGLQRALPGLRRAAARSKAAMGAAFLLIGLGLWFNLNRPVEGWVLSHMPPWLVDLSVSI
jgi:cytochrome c biogenesis protein CcdA